MKRVVAALSMVGMAGCIEFEPIGPDPDNGFQPARYEVGVTVEPGGDPDAPRNYWVGFVVRPGHDEAGLPFPPVTPTVNGLVPTLLHEGDAGEYHGQFVGQIGEATTFEIAYPPHSAYDDWAPVHLVPIMTLDAPGTIDLTAGADLVLHLDDLPDTDEWANGLINVALAGPGGSVSLTMGVPASGILLIPASLLSGLGVDLHLVVRLIASQVVGQPPDGPISFVGLSVREERAIRVDAP
jgi:hypothetical protein